MCLETRLRKAKLHLAWRTWSGSVFPSLVFQNDKFYKKWWRPIVGILKISCFWCRSSRVFTGACMSQHCMFNLGRQLQPSDGCECIECCGSWNLLRSDVSRWSTLSSFCVATQLWSIVREFWSNLSTLRNDPSRHAFSKSGFKSHHLHVSYIIVNVLQLHEKQQN